MKLLQQIKKLSIATIVLGFISGILFISFPEKCMKYISIAVGVTLIAIAIAGIINYFIDRSSVFSLITGIIVGIFGIIVCVKYEQLISLIIIVIGIFVICAGITNLLTGIKTIALSVFFGWFTLILSVATIVFGVIAILNAASLTVTLVRIIGVGLIIYAILDLVAYFEVRSLAKDIKEAVDKLSDVEVTAEPVNEFAFIDEMTDSKSSDIETEATIVEESDIQETEE